MILRYWIEKLQLSCNPDFVAAKLIKKKSTEKKVAEKKTKEVAVLKPKKLKDGRWQVSLGITIQNGRRINPRRQFQIRADALDFCKTEKRRKKAHGEITANADGVKVAQWMKVDAKMEEAGVSLEDVKSWIDLDVQLREAGGSPLIGTGRQVLRDLKAVQKHGTVVECYNAWVAHLTAKKRRGRYLTNARNFCSNFIYGDMDYRDGGQKENDEKKGWEGFGKDRSILEVTPNEIEAYLAHHPGYFGVISAWLGWAAKNRWLPINPCIGKKPEQAALGAVATLSNEQTKNFLNAAATEKNWEVLTFLVFSLFGGVRPEEFRKVAKGSPTLELRWDDLQDDGLEIPPELAKTKAGRVADLETVLCQWVDYIRTHRGEELVGPMPNKGWSKTWKNWRKKHWEGKWPQDLLRHTFGSNHLARSQSTEVTSRVMGNTPEVLDKHYWNWKTRKKHAAVYWNFGPRQVIEKSLK